MFTNYSQTYSAGIIALAGVLVTVAGLFGIVIDTESIIFGLGAIANFVGVVWVLIHRASKNDITSIGARKLPSSQSI